MTDRFDTCLQFVLREEGGKADRPLHEDPGGKTNMGVTHSTLAEYRHMFSDDNNMPVDVNDLTHEDAARIYRRLYWERCRCDDLPEPMDLITFDAAVLSGPGRAARWLQRALAVKGDGWIGPKTIAAALNADHVVMSRLAIYFREEFMRGLANAMYNPGWWDRLDRLRKAVEGQ